MPHTAFYLAFIMMTSTIGGCSAGLRSGGEPYEAMSLLGKPLYAPELSLDVMQERSLKLGRAHMNYILNPGNERNLIWFGRRLAYLGRYNEAIDVYTKGIGSYPESYRLRRHRGHRYITLRKFDEAIEDLAHAAELIEGVPDEIEPDGLPNAMGVARSTTHTNIYYHLGLAYYLNRRFEVARRTFITGLDASRNDDMRCAMTYWLYLSLRRLGLDSVADSVLEPIHEDMEVIENMSYHSLLLMFKGEYAPEDIAPPAPGREEGSDTTAESGTIDDATIAYGLGIWRFVSGDLEGARRVFLDITDGEAWPAFGHIAAEAELRAMMH